MSIDNQKQQPLVGSYAEGDCLFLLKPIEADFQTIKDKEKLIQLGKKHYSEMIHKEQPPTAEYTELFFKLTERYQQRLANEVLLLAQLIAERRSGRICLVSLARAGTPIGVLLQRALHDVLDRESCHYSISIVRDRGIDANALDYLLETAGERPESIVFVDGWTAKGVITRELQKAVQQYNQQRNCNVPPELFVVSDIGGSADVAATYADYTIPSALMNSTVSGLISRSVLNEQIGPDDFHGCVRYDHLKPYDESNWFIDQITSCFNRNTIPQPVCIPREQRQQLTKAFLDSVQAQYQIADINRIKPGIAEATRVMLRRVPDLLLVRSTSDLDVEHLMRLAEEKQVPVVELKSMPFGACGLIKDVVKEQVA